jgi:hypothetical protein
MACHFSTDGKLVICGGGRKRGYYFSRGYREVLYCDSLWYEPNLVKNLRRKKFERIDLFVARAIRKLKFRPLTFRGWWRVIAVPMMRAMDKDKKGAS